MVELREGQTKDTEQLAALVFDSAPLLLPYLFGGGTQALDYIKQAMTREDGQYSAKRHVVACEKTESGVILQKSENVVACITLWHDGLNEVFHQQTLGSLSSLLSDEQLRHLVAVNPQLTKVFVAPGPHELCVGHLSVSTKYQGKGLGKKLIAYTISQANRLSKTKIVLDVDAQNERAIRFYQSCNFIQETKNAFAPTNQQFLRMSFTV